jgi:hypothetical protein
MRRGTGGAEHDGVTGVIAGLIALLGPRASGRSLEEMSQ